MPLELISTLIVGATAALMTWLVFRVRRRPVPRRLLPLAVGAGMIAYAVYSEYSWWWRTADALPAGVEVIETLPQRSPWRPWTYLKAPLTRMIAVDRESIRRNPSHADMLLIDLVLLERWLPARRVVRLVDCAGRRSADVTDPSVFMAGGLPPSDAFSALRPEGPLYRALCAASPDEEPAAPGDP
jgi:hypothetical protein